MGPLPSPLSEHLLGAPHQILLDHTTGSRRKQPLPGLRWKRFRRAALSTQMKLGLFEELVSDPSPRGSPLLTET